MSSDTKDIYVSLTREEYTTNKAAILQSQVHLLTSLKHMQNLRILARQKRDLRERLYKQFDQVIAQVNRIESKFPKPNIPKRLRTKKGKSSEQRKVDKLDLNVKRDYSKRDQIDDELMAIKLKLARLNKQV